MRIGELGDGHGTGNEFLLEHKKLWEFECDKVEYREGSEASKKGFAVKDSISEMVSLGEGGEKTVEVKVFMVEDCREKNLVIKDEVGSVDCFGGKYRSDACSFVYKYNVGGEQSLKLKEYKLWCQGLVKKNY